MNFSFGSKYDLWEVYDAIRKYYPIGIEYGEGDGIFKDYSGTKELNKIIKDNIVNNENYEKNWASFTNQIGIDLGLSVKGTTYGIGPSYSASILIERNQNGDLLHFKELKFSVSLIGKFYQIYGFDLTRVRDKARKNAGFHAVNAVTVSPLDEFKKPFEQLREEILKSYSDYKFIPFFFGQMTIRGLKVSSYEDSTVNEALFNDFLKEKRITRNIRGDRFYGEEDWYKELKV